MTHGAFRKESHCKSMNARLPKRMLITSLNVSEESETREARYRFQLYSLHSNHVTLLALHAATSAKINNELENKDITFRAKNSWERVTVVGGVLSPVDVSRVIFKKFQPSAECGEAIRFLLNGNASPKRRGLTFVK